MDKFIAHFGLPTPIIIDFIINTDSAYFELEDNTAKEIELHTVRGSGMAKFNNQDKLNLSVVNYDKFVTSITDEPFKNGRKRCDVVLSCTTTRYFILAELKDRNPVGNVRRGAKKQLLASLITLLDVPEIKSHIDSKVVKRCCYFNKKPVSPPLLTATTAFNRLAVIYPDGFKMSSPDIEACDFEFYEYIGDQTMTLTS